MRTGGVGRLSCIVCGLMGIAVGWFSGGLVYSAEVRPHVVYFLVDDLGRADCGFMGGTDVKTPHIDRLAHSGAILDAYYVQPVCSPTRAALMTGRYATHTGVYTIVRPNAPWGLPLNERLLSEGLKEAGYATAIFGKWHLGDFEKAYRPISRGFDYQYGHLFGAIDYYTHKRDGKLDWYRNDEPCTDEGYSTELLAREACQFIGKHAPEKPLFLYVPFNGIHAPHQAPEKHLEKYRHLNEPRGTIAAMLSSVDEAIGEITSALDAKGMLQKTLIVFSSDNGGPGPGKATFNTPLRAGKGTIYEGGVRACAFATYPGAIPAGKTIREPIHVVDWYPTLMKLVGGRTEQPLPPDGVDIWPVLTKGAARGSDAILIAGTRPDRAAVRMGDWKLLKNPIEKGSDDTAEETEETGVRYELYHLTDDLSERKNLYETHREKAAQLQARLEAFYEGAVDPGGNDVRRKGNAKGGKTGK